MVDNSLHVRADRLFQHRRNILESAMQSAYILKNIKLVKALGKQKRYSLNAFKKSLNELSGLISELNLKDVHDPSISKQIAPKIKIKKVDISPFIPKEKSQIERDLEDIKNKLQGLNF